MEGREDLGDLAEGGVGAGVLERSTRFDLLHQQRTHRWIRSEDRGDVGCRPVNEPSDLLGHAFPVGTDLQDRPFPLRGPATKDHRHAAFCEGAVELEAPTFPDDEQATRQLVHPGVDTVAEAPHKSLTRLVEVGHTGVIAPHARRATELRWT